MRRAALACAVLAALSGCDGGGGIDADAHPRLVLQPADLSPEFILFDEGRQGNAEQPAGERSDPARFGREGGWKARYRRQGTPETDGALVVESRADVFEGEEGAKEDLAASEAGLGGGAGGVPLELVGREDLGDEAFVATAVQGGAAEDVRFYLVAWREGNVTASVFANGFEGSVALADALALARKQQERIVAQAD
jgi:hypothetical protein